VNRPHTVPCFDFIINSHSLKTGPVSGPQYTLSLPCSHYGSHGLPTQATDKAIHIKTSLVVVACMHKFPRKAIIV